MSVVCVLTVKHDFVCSNGGSKRGHLAQLQWLVLASITADILYKHCVLGLAFISFFALKRVTRNQRVRMKSGFYVYRSLLCQAALLVGK